MDFNTKLMIFSGAGALLPDIIRLVKEKTMGLQAYFTSVIFYIGLALQVGLGLLAYYLISPVDVKQALAIGYAGPAVITSLLGGAISGGSNKGIRAAGVSKILWWWQK